MLKIICFLLQQREVLEDVRDQCSQKHNISRIFDLNSGTISCTQNGRFLSEYYSQLVNFLEELKLYHPVTSNLDILKR